MTVLHTEPNEERIDTVYAYLSIDKQGNNGILAHVIENLGSTPLVTSKRRVAEQMKPLAEHIAKATGMRVGLFEFKRSAFSPIWEFKP